VRIERATERDVPVILSLIKGLAEYEHMASDVVADEALVHKSLFGPAPSAEVHDRRRHLLTSCLVSPHLQEMYWKLTLMVVFNMEGRVC